MRIAIATSSAVPPEFDDDELLISALAARNVEAARVAWDLPGVRWDSFDRVVIRSTWDYPRRHEAFLRWADSLDGRLHNPPRVVRWNSDKRYLGDLASAGLPVVPTHFLAPGSAIPRFEGEVVVKPTISSGGRDTGRFGPATYAQARALIVRLHRGGRAVMVQPYLRSVDALGEQALAFIGGEFSHALRKRAVLRPDEEAPVRDDPLGAAEAMYDPALVEPGAAGAAELALAVAAVTYLRDRFDVGPLQARVDLVEGPDGEPLVLELEAVEPSLYLGVSPDAAEKLADAIVES